MRTVTSAVLLLLSLLSGSASSQEATRRRRQYVVFGDSLSDTGNSYCFSNFTEPPSSLGYFQGRFSNGPVWVDYLQGPTVLSDMANPGSVINYAVGGATACPGLSVMNNAVSLSDQVARFAAGQEPWKDSGTPWTPDMQQKLQAMLSRNATDSATGGPVRPTGSIAVIIGSNDYIRAIMAAATQGEDLVPVLQALPPLVVNCTMQAVRQLVSLVSPPTSNTTLRDPRTTRPPVGPVTAIMVASLPPVEVSPIFQQVAPPGARAAMQQAVQQHNSLLNTAVQAFTVERGGNRAMAPRVTYFDLYTSTMQVRNSLVAQGTVDVTGSCVNYALLYPVLKTMLSRARLMSLAGDNSTTGGHGMGNGKGSGGGNGRGGGRGARRLPPSPPPMPAVLARRLLPDPDAALPGVVSSAVPTVTAASTSPPPASVLVPPAFPAAPAATAPPPSPHGAVLGLMINKSKTDTNSTMQHSPATSNSDITTTGLVSNLSTMFFRSVSSVCTNADSFFFYDAVHPTSHVHQGVAAAIFEGLAAAQAG